MFFWCNKHLKHRKMYCGVWNMFAEFGEFLFIYFYFLSFELPCIMCHISSWSLQYQTAILLSNSGFCFVFLLKHTLYALIDPCYCLAGCCFDCFPQDRSPSKERICCSATPHPHTNIRPWKYARGYCASCWDCWETHQIPNWWIQNNEGNCKPWSVGHCFVNGL